MAFSEEYWALDSLKQNEFRMTTQTIPRMVVGDCMSPGILPGTTAFFEPKQPKHGDVVYAVINGKNATMKRYLEMNGNAVLRADQPGYPEFVVNETVEIKGVLIGMSRRGFKKVVGLPFSESNLALA